MFRFTKSQLPNICNRLYTNNNDVHQCDTRQRSLLHVPLTNCDVFKRTIVFAGVSVCNSDCVKNIDTKCLIFTFKKNVKNILSFNSLV